ncbi:hypothetical protein IWQ56_000146 [Coemansia nantahalensis]|uniref:Uncharacterized protein n=1 Tax=Coemansia nantahalensis TaxID=2789366 RepID=A0ACC1K7Z5_9FUNG|nr:hypothetical protein IWQ57_000486 [Coemansia nantahalensis]KAJ2775299.1 hypothetical protein IWQ56_000146 [Coemansia nantahalensis]
MNIDTHAQAVVDDEPMQPLSPEDKDRLDSRLSHRPTQQELVERHVLLEPGVAPALQSAKAALERSRLEDGLERRLEHRPTKEELIGRHVLLDSHAAPALQSKQAELAFCQLEDKLDSKLAARPTRDELVEQHIIPSE